MADQGKDRHGTVPILDVGTVHDKADQQAERIGDDVALAAFLRLR